MVEVAIAPGHHRGELAEHQFGHRRRRSAPLRGGAGEHEVLELVAGTATVSEVVPQPTVPLLIQHLGPGEAAGEGGQQVSALQAVVLCQAESLAPCRDRSRHHHLVAGLANWPEPLEPR